MQWIITELPLSAYLLLAVAVGAADAAIHPGSGISEEIICSG